MDPKTLEILQSIKDDIGEIKVSQKGVERDLIHMHEKNNAVAASVENVRLEIDPIKRHVQGMQFVGKVLAVISVLASITVSAMKVFAL